tara:strand:+ start:1705 stop:2163 length:459 start_codon:yes stop_codon:yes gene_type:complete
MSEIVNIIFGTQTGNAEHAAYTISNYVESNGFKTEVQDLDNVEIDKLKEMKNLMIVTSTFGDGEMPGNANIFWTKLTSANNDNLDLSGVNYSVLALGDSSHADFCNAGKLLDEKIHKQGANKLLERAECDVEYEKISEEWSQKFVSILKSKN